MSGRESGLAARFRKAVLDRDQARKQAEEDAKLAGERARAARAELLTELVAFAREIGVVRAVPEKDGLTLRFGDRYLHFGADGDGDRLKIEFEGMGDEQHAVYRQAELGDRWVYVRLRKHREDRIPLFDAGLEELLVRGLGMPKPGDDPGPVSTGPRKL